jgi:hypothetical protein
VVPLYFITAYARNCVFFTSVRNVDRLDCWNKQRREGTGTITVKSSFILSSAKGNEYLFCRNAFGVVALCSFGISCTAAPEWYRNMPCSEIHASEIYITRRSCHFTYFLFILRYLLATKPWVYIVSVMCRAWIRKWKIDSRIKLSKLAVWN